MLQVCAAAGEGQLAMSPGPESGLVTILNISHASPHFKRTCETPRWPDTGRPVHLRPPAAYSVEFTMTVSADPRPSLLAGARLTLQDGDTGLVFRGGSLEPLRAGNCSAAAACHQCVEDSLCGWCPSSRSCHLRRPEGGGQVEAACGELLTLDSGGCEDCEDQVYCRACVEDPACQWHAQEVACARRQQLEGVIIAGAGAVLREVREGVVTEGADCPSECGARRSCGECVGGAGRCVWCRATQQCLLFSVYTSDFQVLYYNNSSH